jgi:hypothetical protein
MPPRLRKFALAAHVTVSVGWLGAVAAYLALAIAARSSLGVEPLADRDAETVRAAWLAMELTGWFVIVPLALASLLSGLANALGTPWGLFRHYWVVAKLLITVFATAILLQHMPTVSFLAGVAATADSAHLRAVGSDLLHAGGGLALLLVTTTLAIYKPAGMTRYGWRKHHERRTPP